MLINRVSILSDVNNVFIIYKLGQSFILGQGDKLTRM